MASGQIFGTTDHPSGQISARIDWSSTPNNAANASTINSSLWLMRAADGYTTWGSGSFGLNVDAQGWADNTREVSLSGGNWVQVASSSRTVPHNPDGTRQASISARGSLPGTGLNSVNCSGTVTLDTIPRASQPSMSSTNFDLGSTITVKTNRASTGFTHAVRFSLGSYAATIGDNVTDQLVYTFPVSLAAQMPNNTQMQGRLWVDTYSGGVHIGTKEVYFTARVPASVVPTAGALTVSDASGHTTKTGGLYVQGQSRASVAVGQSSGAQGSTIRSVAITVGATTQAATMATFELPTAGTITITATVTDSRGRVATRSATITVAAYSPPTISTMSISRVNSAGTAEDMGSYIRAITAGSASTIAGNRLDWAVQMRPLNGTWSNLKTGADTAAPFAWSDNSILGGGGISPTSSYEIRVVATDAITTTTLVIVVPTGSVTMAWGRNNVGIGKVPERGTLDVAGLIYGSSDIQADGLLREAGLGIDRLYGAGVVRYDAQQGYLIQTDIGLADNVMWMLDIRFNTYGNALTTGTGEIQAQGYAYGSGSAIINTAASSEIGRRDLYAFFLNGQMHIWLPAGVRYETALISLSSNTGRANRRILAVTDAAMPSSGISRTVAIVPEVLGYKPQASSAFTYSTGTTAGTSRTLATATITVQKPSMLFFAGNCEALTDGNAAAWIDVEVVGVGSNQVRFHSYSRAVTAPIAWCRGFILPSAGTYTVRAVARVDPTTTVNFQDVHAAMWTF